MGENLHLERLLLPRRLPVIAAMLPKDLPVARAIAAHANPTELAADDASKWVGVDALPFLTATAAGRRFLSLSGPRALARGDPPEIYPAVSVAHGAPATPPTSPDDVEKARADVAAAALQSCLGKLAALGEAGAGCGCRVLALDHMVTVPRSDLAYATGTTAVLRAPALGPEKVLVAEDDTRDGHRGDTTLRDLRGPVAVLHRGAGDSVDLRLLDGGPEFRGYRITVGYRRGRLAERIYARDPKGDRLSLLIGFSPDEVAQTAGAWLAWPSDAGRRIAEAEAVQGGG